MLGLGIPTLFVIVLVVFFLASAIKIMKGVLYSDLAGSSVHPKGLGLSFSFPSSTE
jgi:hypothetical protein